jgi:hypothetical protein
MAAPPASDHHSLGRNILGEIQSLWISTFICSALKPDNERLARTNAQTIKIAKTKTLDKPLFFGYSFSSNPDYAYCEYSISTCPLRNLPLTAFFR